ncbi:hydrophobic surface binding protein A-domain-containing protein [Flagelloscypha sp. PMI_526]|nr:hydrophobic surface binding protein A-domain-containing protein [Flagelloscypha sp. PMI_526]
MHLQSIFGLILAASTVFASVLRRDFATLMWDIADMQTSTNQLDFDINWFPTSGATIINTINIHTDFVAVINTTKQGTLEALSTGPIDLASGQTLYDTMAALKPVYLDILAAFVTKKPSFDSIPLSGITAVVLSDLKNWESAVSLFFNELLFIIPDSYYANMDFLWFEIDNGFSATITAWS